MSRFGPAWGGIGGWIGTKRGERIAREILAELPAGWNTVRIFNEDNALPYIQSISVTPFGDPILFAQL